MTDLPADVRRTLLDLLTDAREHARARATGEVDELVARLRELVEEEVPDGPTKARLRHGLDRVDRLAADEPLVAAEYFRAMHERVENLDASS